jgi:predicted acyltransferase
MRYPSLDFFRGLTIALMIVVNDPGTWSHVYAPLRHAAWHGCTPTDLVFPSFLFIVGVAMWFSFSKFNGQMSAALARKILRRTALIFLVGLALNAYPFFNKDWSTLRIMGVLQRIGLAYGLAAFLCISLKKRHLIVTTALMLVGYWLMMWLRAGDESGALV